MAIEDILGGLFPIQKFGSEAASQGFLGVLPKVASGMSPVGQMGLMGLLSPQILGAQDHQGSSPNQAFVEQASPEQFLSGGQGQQSSVQGVDPIALLDQNINRRFGL